MPTYQNLKISVPECPFRIICVTESHTESLAQSLAQHAKTADCFLLYGAIGTGKSVFARAFIRKCLKNNKAEVPSPTYTLVQSYKAKDMEIWHADLYRLGSVHELEELSLQEAMGSALCLIEWPELLGSIPPITDATEIWFEHLQTSPDARTLHIRPGNQRVTDALWKIQEQIF